MDRQLPRSVALFGDSIGRGFLADTVMGERLSFRDTFRWLSIAPIVASAPWLRRNGDDSLPPSVLEIFDRRFSQPKLNAFVGDESWSHAKRIAALGESPDVYNFSRLASTFAHGELLLNDAKKYYQQQSKDPADYVVVSMGAVDFCLGERPDAETWNLYIRSFLDGLIKLHSRSVILVTAVPNIVQIATLPDGVAFRALNQKTKCSHLRKQTGKICRWLPTTGASPEEVFEAQQIFDAYNVSLGQEVERLKMRLEEESSDVRIAFVRLPQIDNLEISELLAVDCFHPNILGHQRLAESTWNVAKALF